MDVTQALKDAENALRDFIGAILSAKHGQSWLDQTGVSPDRLAKWKERKETEAKRQQAGVVEERILYYADFYDLSTILKKNWDDFAPALGEWKTMEVWLKELERFRDPDAHRREFLPHQKHLILGISGEIRNRIVRYRSKQETADDYFPRIESARDSLGNIRTAGGGGYSVERVTILRPGDVIDFVVTATDPLGEELSYGLAKIGGNDTTWPIKWHNSGSMSTRIEEADISTSFDIMLLIKSSRKYHAKSSHDDAVLFHYKVLPPKQQR
jgi:hypothetical protein